MADMADAPVLFAPTLPNPGRSQLLFLPGLDGTGGLLAPQVPALTPHFDVRCLLIPSENRSGWHALAATVVEQIQRESRDRPLFLVGESFGACLALQVALQRPDLVDHLVLINAASSLRRQPWLRWITHTAPWVPDWVFRSSGALTLTLLAAFDRMRPPIQRLFVETVRPIPQDCVAWRLSLLRDFAPEPEAFQTLTMPTLLIASDRDRLLPSVQEAHRLQRLIPHSQIHYLPDSGHVALLEQDVNLADILGRYNRLPRPITVSLGQGA
jgi:pimeloyl-ACP methyl ester carboxylesterase